jgi:hypothetical protein
MGRTIYKCPNCDSKIPTERLLHQELRDPRFKETVLDYHKQYNEYSFAICRNCGQMVNPKPKTPGGKKDGNN